MSDFSDAQSMPWPGPKPYTEKEAKYFFGRDREVRSLLQRITTQRLTILTAMSGTGKSSLIRAGLIPALRKRRQAEPQGIGTTLLLRDWGHLSQEFPARLIVESIRGEIRRLGEMGKDLSDEQLLRDVSLLDNVPAPPPDLISGRVENKADFVVRYVSDLCDAVGNLVLIIDQAEELLGSGIAYFSRRVEDEALEVIGSVFRHEDRVKLMISLRQEYVARLRPLESYVDSLARREFHLEPMIKSTVRGVIMHSAETAESVSIDEEAVDAIIDFVIPAGLRDTSADKDLSPVDLLELQALLVESCKYAECKVTDGRVHVTRQLLHEFKADLLKEVPEEQDEFALVRIALRRYTKRLFEENRRSRSLTKPSIAMMQRAAVRMARWLSSPGGFKRHVEQTELVFNVISEDLDALSSGSQRHSHYEKRARAALDKLRLSGDCELVEALFGKETAGSDREVLSGDARIYGWSVGRTATMIARAAFDALDLLEHNNVLKIAQSMKEGTRFYELVHDGFGPALTLWAESVIGSTNDALASVVASLGTNFHWDNLKNLELENLTWRGCTFSGVTFEDVRFNSCDLRGCIFEKCTFGRCQFVNCDLSGAVFRGGQWEEVKWNNTEADSVLLCNLGCRRIIFENSNLNSGTILNVKFEGEAALKIEAGSSLRGCTFKHVSFDELWFDSSYFLGAAFCDKSTVKVGRVTKCDFTGAIFQDDVWEDVTWDRCTALSAFWEASEWSRVTIGSSRLDNSTIRGVKLKDKLVLNDCSMRFGQIFHFQGDGILYANACDFLNSLVEDYRQSPHQFIGPADDTVLRKSPEETVPSKETGPDCG